jgi:hypothetical protein
LKSNMYIPFSKPTVDSRYRDSQLFCDLAAGKTLRLQPKRSSDHAVIFSMDKLSTQAGLINGLALLAAVGISQDRTVANAFSSSSPSDDLASFTAVLRNKIDEVKNYRIWHDFPFPSSGHKRSMFMPSASAMASRILRLLCLDLMACDTAWGETSNCFAIDRSVVSWRMSSALTYL